MVARPASSGWIGQPILRKEDRRLLTGAARFVAYDPLPAVVDVDRAVDPDAPTLYPEWGDNLVYRTQAAHGDIQSAFAAADVVIRQRVSYPRHAPLPIETRGVVAHYDPATEEL